MTVRACVFFLLRAFQISALAATQQHRVFMSLDPQANRLSFVSVAVRFGDRSGSHLIADEGRTESFASPESNSQGENVDRHFGQRAEAKSKITSVERELCHLSHSGPFYPCKLRLIWCM